MSDMDVGGDHPRAVPFAAIEDVAEEDREAVEAAINRAMQPNELDEVKFASSLLWSYVADLERSWRGLRSGKSVAAVDAAAMKVAVAAAKDVRDACVHLRQEREKVDKLRREIAGGVGGGSLDLDSARDEIGRRLACLRRAGGS